MQDYKDYEGRCKYCGHTELILSESQEQADEHVSRKCLCEGRKIEERRNKLNQAITEITKADEYLNLRELDENTKDLVHGIGEMVLDEKIEKASITVQGSTITIKGGSKI
nr:hypothetical protein [uncultured Prevotella sp.]